MDVIVYIQVCMFMCSCMLPCVCINVMSIYIQVCLCVCHWVSGFIRSWKMYRLLEAAMAMIFSSGCHAMCRIFFLKSRLSTPTSPRRRRPPVYTLRVLSTALGLLFSRQASSVTPRPESRSNIRKKLLYAPVMITLKERGGEISSAR